MHEEGQSNIQRHNSKPKSQCTLKKDLQLAKVSCENPQIHNLIMHATAALAIFRIRNKRRIKNSINY